MRAHLALVRAHYLDLFVEIPGYVDEVVGPEWCPIHRVIGFRGRVVHEDATHEGCAERLATTPTDAEDNAMIAVGIAVERQQNIMRLGASHDFADGIVEGALGDRI